MRYTVYPIEDYSCYELDPKSMWVPPQHLFSIRTCLRFEVFGYGLCPLYIPPTVLRKTVHGWDALRRFIYICCGGESALLGETEILGQVKAQYHKQFNLIDRRLHWFLQAGLWGAKRLRAHAPISSGPSSYGGWVRRKLHETKRIFEDTSSVLFVGAGNLLHEIAHFVAPHIAPQRLHWMNRTPSKLDPLIKRHGGTKIRFDPGQLSQFPYVMVAIALPPDRLSHWRLASSEWRERHCTTGLYIDLSSPSLIGECFSENICTLSTIEQFTEQERQQRAEKRARLCTEIDAWLTSRWQSERRRAVL